MAEALFRRHPELSEGDLSRLRSSLVRGDTLAEVARDIRLGGCLQLGPGERKSGGFRRQSILADALEGLIGAIYLDGGIESADEVIQHLWGGRLQSLPAAGELKDPKTRLQEYLQGRGQALPDYHLESISGDDHRQTFHITCTIADAGCWRGQGPSRRRAEQAAADAALAALVSDE
jgi:ribonuclease III